MNEGCICNIEIKNEKRSKVMEEKRVLAVMGSPSSGKTTTAIKLASLLAEKKKNVILVFCDPFTPVIPTILPVTVDHETSLGKLLTAPSLTQTMILQACVPTENDYISVLGYKKGESLMYYPTILREQVIELFVFLRHLADYVIIDCSSVFEADPTSIVAIEVADQVLKLGTANLKGISYYQTHEKMLVDSCFKKERQKMAIGVLQVGQDWEAVSSQYGGVDFVLPYVEELDQQNNELCLFKSLHTTESKAYQREVEHMMKGLFGIEEFEKKEKSKKVKKQAEERKEKEEKKVEREKKTKSFSFSFSNFLGKKKGEF